MPAVEGTITERTPLLINQESSVSESVTIGRPCAHSTPVASGWLYFSIISCVIGTSFSFGFSIGCINTPAKAMQDVYKEWYYNVYGTQMPSATLTLLWAFTVSAYCLGGLIAGSVGGVIADKFGRKRSMMVLNILQIVSTLLMFSSIWIQRYEVIIIGRLICGFYGGIATVITPLYLNEISLPSLKGKVGTMNQLMIVVSLTLALVLGLPQLLGTEERFYYLLGLPLVTGVLHWLMFAFCPESPSWLYLFKKDKDSARLALEKLRDMNVMSSVESELAEYYKQEVEADSAPKVSLGDMFTSYRTRPLILACIMQCSQQLSGINAVNFYSTSIFVHASLSHEEAQYATLSLSGIMIIMTFVCLGLVDKLGRRVLHLTGLGGCVISLIALTVFLTLEEQQNRVWSYLCIASVGIFVITFNIGPGSIPWFYTTELFEPNSTKWAIGISTAVNWLCNFAVGLVFLPVQKALGDNVFIPFIIIVAILWLFIYFRAPETKGRSVLQITERYKILYNMPDVLSRERNHFHTFQEPLPT